MKRRVIPVTIGCFVLFFITLAQVTAQSKKPSQELRRVVERQEELFEKFDSEVSEGKAQSYEWDARVEMLRRNASESAAGFKIGDWKGDELKALATLYQFAEEYGPAAEAFRALLASNRDLNRSGRLEIRVSYARALLETDQLGLTEKVLEEMYDKTDENPGVLTSRIALHKDLAVALRDRGQLEQAADQAKKGYHLAEAANRGAMTYSRLRDTTLRDQFTLAAVNIAINERLKKNKEAENFSKLVMNFDLEKQPGLRLFYQSELSIARLIGSEAPEIIAAEWIEGQPNSLDKLRGKVVLLDFWAMWCSPCIAAFPNLRGFQTKYESKGFEIIGVTRFYGRSDNEEDISHEKELKSLEVYKRKHQLRYPFAVAKMDDVTNEERYSASFLPTVLLIDRRGNVRHLKRGVGEYNKLERKIVKLIDEKL